MLHLLGCAEEAKRVHSQNYSYTAELEEEVAMFHEQGQIEKFVHRIELGKRATFQLEEVA